MSSQIFKDKSRQKLGIWWARLRPRAVQYRKRDMKQIILKITWEMMIRIRTILKNWAGDVSSEMKKNIQKALEGKLLCKIESNIYKFLEIIL